MSARVSNASPAVVFGLLSLGAMLPWDRFIANVKRNQAVLEKLRMRVAPPPHELDEVAAVSWTSTHSGLPDEDDCHAWRTALHDLITPSQDPAIEGAAEPGEILPRRLLRQLLAQPIDLERAGKGATIGELLQLAYEDRPGDGARALLLDHGIRVVGRCVASDAASKLRCDCQECRRSTRGPVPRMSKAAGAWLGTTHPRLRQRFAALTPPAVSWQRELARLPSARRYRGAVRMGAVSCPAIWLQQTELLSPDDGSGGA
jgi:hypothetical protein